MNEQTTPITRKDIEAYIIAQSWKDEAYKQELLSNSKAVIEKEFGVQLPTEVSVKVVEENSTTLYFVLPIRPDMSSSELSDEELETVAGGATPSVVVTVIGAAFTLGVADGVGEKVSGEA